MKGILITAVGGIGVGSQIVESLCLPSEIPLYLVGTDTHLSIRLLCSQFRILQWEMYVELMLYQKRSTKLMLISLGTMLQII